VLLNTNHLGAFALWSEGGKSLHIPVERMRKRLRRLGTPHVKRLAAQTRRLYTLAPILNSPTRSTWLLTAALSLAFSTAAVLVNASLRYQFSLGALAQFADQFAAPGELLWWSTLGGAFAGRPAGAAGISLWILGTALFWFFVSAGVLLLFAWFRSRVQSKGT
jgi:hypothetical protein